LVRVDRHPEPRLSGQAIQVWSRYLHDNYVLTIVNFEQVMPFRAHAQQPQIPSRGPEAPHRAGWPAVRGSTMQLQLQQLLYRSVGWRTTAPDVGRREQAGGRVGAPPAVPPAPAATAAAGPAAPNEWRGAPRSRGRLPPTPRRPPNGAAAASQACRRRRRHRG